MSTKTLSVDELVALAAHLSAQERVRLTERIVANLSQDSSESARTPRRSLRGLWADLGPAPTDEEIEEDRREMWGTFAEGDAY